VTVIFLSSDLMFSSRLLGAAQALSTQVQVAARPAALAEKLTDDCRLVLVDLSLDELDLPAAIATVRAVAPQARVVAFDAHVNEAALSAASLTCASNAITRA